MGAPTIVTAFFDIGRDHWSEFPRNLQKYMTFFAFWARIHNDMVVYADPRLVSEIKKIRKEFGLENKTIVVPVDCMSCDPMLYKSIEDTMQNPNFGDFRIKPNNPESKEPKYNYIMMLKAWCMEDAVKNSYVKTQQVAWIDFGFNNGGEFYENPNQFDFLWTPKYNPEKIHCYTIHPLNQLPIHQIISKMSTYIQGMPVIVPTKMCAWYYEKMRDCMFCLNRCGLADDDQVIVQMVYRENKDQFEIHPSERWCDFLSQTANITMKKVEQKSMVSKMIAQRDQKRYLKNMRKQYLKTIEKSLEELDQ